MRMYKCKSTMTIEADGLLSRLYLCPLKVNRTWLVLFVDVSAGRHGLVHLCDPQVVSLALCFIAILPSFFNCSTRSKSSFGGC